MQTSGWVSTELPCNCTVSLGGCSKRAPSADCLLIGCYNHKDGKYDGGFEVVGVEERKEGSVITNGGGGGVKMAWREPFGTFDMVVVRWSLMPDWLVEGIDATRRETGDLVLCACTDGAARIYHIEATADGFKRSVILTVQLHDEMLTSATCHTVIPTGDAAPQLLMIAASAHKGGLCVTEVKDITGACLRQVVVPAHEFDAWCVAAHPLSLSSKDHGYPLLWTGGDDGKMKLWSSADVLARGDDSPALYSQLRGFDAGVVTIVPLCIEQRAAVSEESSATPTTSLATFLLIGSYDEHLRCIDVTGLSEFSAPLSSLNEEDGADGEEFSTAAMRAKMLVAASMKRPIFEQHLEGGVWRVRLGEGCTGTSQHSTTNNTPVAVLEEGQSSTIIKAAVATMQRGAVALTLGVVASGTSALLSVVDESVVHFHEGILGAPVAQSDDKEEEQQPLVYDVAFASSTGAIVSLSFYDRHVALSSSSDAKQE